MGRVSKIKSRTSRNLLSQGEKEENFIDKIIQADPGPVLPEPVLPEPVAEPIRKEQTPLEQPALKREEDPVAEPSPSVLEDKRKQPEGENTQPPEEKTVEKEKTTTVENESPFSGMELLTRSYNVSEELRLNIRWEAKQKGLSMQDYICRTIDEYCDVHETAEENRKEKFMKLVRYESHLPKGRRSLTVNIGSRERAERLKRLAFSYGTNIATLFNYIFEVGE